MDLLAPIATKLSLWWSQPLLTRTITFMGIAGQLLFSLRWITQWLASERAGTPVVPHSFWYYSLLGGLMVLAYGLYFLDPVVILAQIGVLVYARNVYLLMHGKQVKSKS